MINRMAIAPVCHMSTSNFHTLVSVLFVMYFLCDRLFIYFLVLWFLIVGPKKYLKYIFWDFWDFVIVKDVLQNIDCRNLSDCQPKSYENLTALFTYIITYGDLMEIITL